MLRLAAHAETAARVALVLASTALLIGIGCATSEETARGRSATIGVGKGPDGLALIHDRKLALVANVEDTTLTVVDLDSRRVHSTIPVGRSPWGLARIAHSPELAVTVYNARRIVVVDEHTLRLNREIDVPFRPTGLSISADGSTAYVAGDDHQLHVFDLTAGVEQRSVPVGTDPDGVALTADGSAVWVTNTSGSVSVINLDDWTETRLSNAGKPEQIVAHPSRPLMFVSNYTRNTLLVYRTDTLELEHTLLGDEHGFRGPEEVRFSEDGTRMFLAAFESGNVSCFDMTTYSPCGQWRVGRGSIAVELAASGRLVTTNYSDDTISVVDIESPY